MIDRFAAFARHGMRRRGINGEFFSPGPHWTPTDILTLAQRMQSGGPFKSTLPLAGRIVAHNSPEHDQLCTHADSATRNRIRTCPSPPAAIV
jgi:hypothetical protein